MSKGILRRKSAEQALADREEPDKKLRKELTTRDLTVFGVAIAIGAGIFTLTARTAGDTAGPSVSIAFVLAAISCGLATLCYAEFASTIPVAGSAYTLSYVAFGELVAWIIGWDIILELALSSAVVAKGWSAYLSGLLGSPETTSLSIGPVDFDWGALLVVVVITALLAIGAKVSSRVSLIMTAIKVGVILLVVVVGAFYIKASNYVPFIPPSQDASTAGETVQQSLFSFLTGAGASTYGAYGLLAAASLVFFAFIGFDVVATAAEETKDPQKSLPRGILGSLAIVTVLYVAVTVVVTGMVDYEDLRTGGPLAGSGGATLATAFEANGITWAQTVINIGALVGLTTVTMVAMFGQTRVLFAMARDGLIPRGLAATGKRGTPVRITVAVGLVVAVLATVVPIGALAEMVNIGTLFAFILVAVGVVVLRRSRPDLPRGFRVPFMPWIPILAVIACGWLMLNLTIETWIRFLVWMVIGFALYFAYGRRHSVLGRAAAVNESPAEPISPVPVTAPD